MQRKRTERFWLNHKYVEIGTLVGNDSHLTYQQINILTGRQGPNTKGCLKSEDDAILLGHSDKHNR